MFFVDNQVGCVGQRRCHGHEVTTEYKSVRFSTLTHLWLWRLYEVGFVFGRYGIGLGKQ